MERKVECRGGERGDKRRRRRRGDEGYDSRGEAREGKHWKRREEESNRRVRRKE